MPSDVYFGSGELGGYGARFRNWHVWVCVIGPAPIGWGCLSPDRVEETPREHRGVPDITALNGITL